MRFWYGICLSPHRGPVSQRRRNDVWGRDARPRTDTRDGSLRSLTEGRDICVKADHIEGLSAALPPSHLSVYLSNDCPCWVGFTLCKCVCAFDPFSFLFFLSLSIFESTPCFPKQFPPHPSSQETPVLSFRFGWSRGPTPGTMLPGAMPQRRPPRTETETTKISPRWD